MTITVNNYLDIGSFITNELVGSIALTYFLGLVAVIYIGIKLNASMESMVALILLYSFGMASLYLGSIILAVILIVMAVGGVTYLFFSKKLNN